jgi:hypothetical protein
MDCINNGDNIDSEENIDSKDNIDSVDQQLQNQILSKPELIIWIVNYWL